MKKYKKIVWSSILLIAVWGIVTVWANLEVSRATKEYLTDDIRQIKPTKVGLLLGTSPMLKNGIPNEFFFNRIDAAVALFQQNKIKYIIVSGDNSRADYNEPMEMKRALIKRGIPDSLIYVDYAGFRTLDSVVRAKEVFGQDSFIVISQKFHNERAVYIARKKNMAAIGFNAKDVNAYYGFKTKIREILSRDKVFIDWMLGIKPKFIGKKIQIK